METVAHTYEEGMAIMDMIIDGEDIGFAKYTVLRPVETKIEREHYVHLDGYCDNYTIKKGIEEVIIAVEILRPYNTITVSVFDTRYYKNNYFLDEWTSINAAKSYAKKKYNELIKTF